jgi:hypothetical protein
MNFCKLVAIPLKMNLHLSKTQSLHTHEEVEAMSYVPYQQAMVFLLMLWCVFGLI